MTSVGAGKDAVSLWRNRDFVALWSGQVISSLGTGISTTAFPLLVLAMVGGPAEAGIVGAAGSAPYLLSLFVGALVDRWNRRAIMLSGQLVAGISLFSVTVAIWLGTLTVIHLALAAFVQGVCAVFYRVAETAALPLIVPPAQRPLAVSQSEARSRGAYLAGPPLGGVLFGLGAAIPFLVDAISYLAGAVGVLAIRRPLQGERVVTRRSIVRDVGQGLQWLWRVAFARTAILLIAASNVVFQALVLILIVLAKDHGGSPGEIGLMMGIYGGGGLVGAFAAGWLHRKLRPKLVLVAINWVWAALLPLLLLTSNPLILGLIAAACAFAGPLWNVVILNYQMAIVPEHMMGRITSTAIFVTSGVMPVGSLGAGFMIAEFGPVHALVVLCVIMLVIAIAAAVSPSVRHAPPPDDLEALAALAPLPPKARA
ncbi:MFS transporter [Micromonospora sp. CNB394]|uniref:MFS transporter n=1 Tax=Micromonospora sp. CNB394 TaxID=1169151 RepID=UPI000361C02E|nr:MFS transporter [Micromonospora sp. CNB394]